MVYRFADFEFDTDRHELRRAGLRVAVEPQVFAVLRLLIEQRGRTVTKQEIIASVWDGRIVSEAALSSRIKSSRQAVGDDGHAQALIRTVHGIGYCFVATVTLRMETAYPAPGAPDAPAPIQPTRPSIAILPFQHLGVSRQEFPIAEALPSDLIAALSRLHWLFVIARGSSFRFSAAGASLDDVRAALKVQYCLTGVVGISGNSMSVSVELNDTSDRGIVWSERFHGKIGAVHEIRERIINAVVSAVEVRIPMNEAQHAHLKSPDSLDAWAAYHLGLRHMYRFNQADNEVATGLFTRAIAMEPEFARAYAGLSFTHFQNAFLRYADTQGSAQLAQRYAAECLERDPLDPFATSPWAARIGCTTIWRAALPGWSGRMHSIRATLRRDTPSDGPRPCSEARTRAGATSRQRWSSARSTHSCTACWAFGPCRISPAAITRRLRRGRSVPRGRPAHIR